MNVITLIKCYKSIHWLAIIVVNCYNGFRLDIHRHIVRYASR